MPPNSMWSGILKTTEFGADSFSQEGPQRRPADLVAGVAGVAGDAFIAFFGMAVIERVPELSSDLRHARGKVDDVFKQRGTPCPRVRSLLP